MNQSAVLKHCYDQIFLSLTELGKKTPVFAVGDGGGNKEKKDKSPVLFLGVTDVSQISQDKTGEKVYINGKAYPEPTFVGCFLSLTVVAEKYSEALEIAGAVIRYFKDENAISLGDYNWHGNDRDKVFLEPIVRQPEGYAGQNLAVPCITLNYRLEVAINSAKEEGFRRVEKRDIRSKSLEQ